MRSEFEPTTFGFPDLPEQEAGTLLIRPPRLVLHCSPYAGNITVSNGAWVGAQECMAVSLSLDVLKGGNLFYLPKLPRNNPIMNVRERSCGSKTKTERERIKEREKKKEIERKREREKQAEKMKE